MEDGDYTPPCVGVFMCTYNHENYIETAIESVMMQVGDFSYRLFIGEDCSTDSTREICIKMKQKYADKIDLTLYEKNVGGGLNTINLFAKIIDAGVTYIAMLDGDDYWVDKEKLKKQVAILENDRGISICFTDSKILNDKTKEFSTKAYDNEREARINFDTFIEKGSLYVTCSALFRTAAIPRRFPDWFLTSLKQDWTIFVLALDNGDAYYLPEITAVYRIHGASLMRTTKHILLEENSAGLIENLLSYFDPRHQPVLGKALTWSYFHVAFFYWNEFEVLDFFKYISKATQAGERKTMGWYWLVIKEMNKAWLKKTYHKIKGIFRRP
jgi:glycosyltransferase involved in cell wall biosynthesis